MWSRVVNPTWSNVMCKVHSDVVEATQLGIRDPVAAQVWSRVGIEATNV